MRLARVTKDGKIGLAAKTGDKVTLAYGADIADLDAHIAAGTLDTAGAKAAAGEAVDEAALTFLPPLAKAGKVICLGLNYADHAAEANLDVPDFPTIFARFSSNLIGHDAPILKPKTSDQLDYEGEMVAVIGKRAKNVPASEALSHVMGYSVFNDGSVRDYQLKTPQWTAGKNFDNTGSFGPWLVTADELPAGGEGLKIETRLNGNVMQSASTDQMIFNVEQTVTLLSSFLTLEPGDVLVMGTPSGIGLARTPPVFMKDGDVIEVEIENIGLLRNPIAAE
ncbi:MAG: fumarylacetoacetate hydrolase family protein [Parasphingorhabdus sp.]|uniref:fumarylacetoacetate hydrolase family protein n=1 Tax=Parasphingorhabdus sp. TaxID=2709688 RepID=UPI00300324EE